MLKWGSKICLVLSGSGTAKLGASSFCRNKFSFRLPVGLLHRIMEAKIGNKQKILDHCVPGPTNYSLLIELLKRASYQR